MIRTIIVDDEPRARESLRLILNKFFPDFDIVGEASGVEEAFNVITKEKPKVVFLDIKMPDGSGFDLLKKFQQIDFRVVFVTAFEEYALDAIKFSAFDYILKPVNPVELLKTVSNCIVEEMAENYSAKFEAFFSNFNPNHEKPQKIVLKTAERIQVVDVANIIRCEADNAYTTFYLHDGPSVLVSKGLKHFEELLQGSNFMRVHQSHLINLDYISYFNKQDGGSLVMNDNSNVPVSSLKRPALLQFLDSF